MERRHRPRQDVTDAERHDPDARCRRPPHPHRLNDAYQAPGVAASQAVAHLAHARACERTDRPNSTRLHPTHLGIGFATMEPARACAARRAGLAAPGACRGATTCARDDARVPRPPPRVARVHRFEPACPVRAANPPAPPEPTRARPRRPARWRLVTPPRPRVDCFHPPHGRGNRRADRRHRGRSRMARRAENRVPHSPDWMAHGMPRGLLATGTITPGCRYPQGHPPRRRHPGQAAVAFMPNRSPAVERRRADACGIGYDCKQMRYPRAIDTSQVPTTLHHALRHRVRTTGRTPVTAFHVSARWLCHRPAGGVACR